jgi:hypothetical protein
MGCGYRKIGGLYLMAVPDNDPDHNPAAGKEDDLDLLEIAAQ